MNDAVIIAVANAITANAEVLKSLIDSLPKATVEAVEKKVTKATPKKEAEIVAETPAPVVVVAPVAPVVETVTQPVVVPVTSAMPVAPFPTVAAQAPANPAPIPVAPVVTIAPTAPVSASPSNVPFNEAKGMMKYVMDSYQALGNIKGARIQEVLGSIGVHNINDVKPEQYAALFAGVEALKNG